MNHYKYFFVLALISTSLACGINPRSGIDPESGAKAGALIQSSFSVTKAPLLSVDKANIVIKKLALEKEFLLQLEIITQIKTPSFEAQKSRVVFFRLKNDRLYLMEAVSGHTVTNDIPQNLILAEFQIIRQNNEDIVFDFNKGMSRLYVKEDWRGHDDNKKKYEDEFTSVKIDASYIDEAKILPSNKLLITQLVKTSEDSENYSSSNHILQTKYYFTPYNPDKTFLPTPYSDFDQFGFFEVAPQLSTQGGVLVRATKFHPDQPIVYAISANTPPEYKQAVKDGILYWNKAFGKEIVQVIDAPKGVTAPDFNYNIVQWLNYDDAGMAYADAQMDPRSGQIMHAQVFMTSAFAFSSRWKAQLLYSTLSDTSIKKDKSSYSIKGFENGDRCKLEMDQKFAKALSQLLASDVKDEAFLKTSQNYIKETIAHEVGHTLGLRHNFAGSQAINYSLDSRGDIFKQYIQTQTLPDNIVPTSSVMDYNQFLEAVFIGDLITNSKTAFNYDKKAIETLYYNKKFASSELPLFCTDSQLKTYSDCKQFDLGDSLVEFVKYSEKSSIENLSSSLMFTFIKAKVGLFDEKTTPVEKVMLDPVGMAKSILSDRSNLMIQFQRGTKLLKISRKFPIEDKLNEDNIRKERLDYLEAELNKYGTLKNIFSPLPNNFVKIQYEKFENLIHNNPYLLSGVGPNQKPFEFTNDEINVIKNRAKLFFEQLREALAKEDISSLKYTATDSKDTDPESNIKLADHPVANQLLDLLKDRINYYVFTKSGGNWSGNIKVEDTTDTKDKKSESTTGYKKKEIKYKDVNVNLAEFAYKFPIRFAASKLIASYDKTPNFVWGLKESKAIADDFEDFMKQTFNTSDLDSVKAIHMPNEAAQWFIENQRILENLK